MRNPLDLWRVQRTASPFTASNQLQRAMDQLLSDFATVPAPDASNGGFAPISEVEETKSHYVAKFELAGMEKDQIKVELHDNRLTVSGEKREEKKEDENHRHFSEFNYGTFFRSFSLPSATDPERIEAQFENGILTVKVPKADIAKIREVKIK
jgi:HSP20 family protein